MDDIDVAAEQIEREADYRLAKAREAAGKRELMPRGTCYYCEEQLDDRRLFCDSDCAVDYQREKAAKARNRG